MRVNKFLLINIGRLWKFKYSALDEWVSSGESAYSNSMAKGIMNE